MFLREIGQAASDYPVASSANNKGPQGTVECYSIVGKTSRLAGRICANLARTSAGGRSGLGAAAPGGAALLWTWMGGPN